MRILHVDTGSTWRGGQQQLCWLMQGLRECGDEQLLITPASSALCAAMQERGFPVTSLSSSGVSPGNMLAIRRAAREFDIVHAHDARAHTLAWLSVSKRRTGPRPQLVVSRRVAFPVGRFAAWKFASADAFIAVSNYCRNQLLDTGVDPKKIHVVFDGVELPRAQLAGEREEFRRRFGAGANVQIMGTLTSVAPEKLLRQEIDLLRRLPDTVQLWIACPPGAETAEGEALLTEYAALTGVGERFRVIPLSGDLGGFFAALDVFIYLSKLEGLGSAILLAMAHGLPVVASRVGGVPEIVRHRETGLLVGESQSEIADAVRSLLESGELSHALGAAARKFASENATTEIVVRKTRAVYAQLLRTAGTMAESQAAGPRSAQDRSTGGSA